MVMQMSSKPDGNYQALCFLKHPPYIVVDGRFDSMFEPHSIVLAGHLPSNII